MSYTQQVAEASVHLHLWEPAELMLTEMIGIILDLHRRQFKSYLYAITGAYWLPHRKPLASQERPVFTRTTVSVPTPGEVSCLQLSTALHSLLPMFIGNREHHGGDDHEDDLDHHQGDFHNHQSKLDHNHQGEHSDRRANDHPPRILRKSWPILAAVGKAKADLEVRQGYSTLAVPMTVAAGQTFDGKMYKYDRKGSSGECQGQTETGEDDAVFIVEAGGTVQNVIIGTDQAEGIHCRGACTIRNVWWEDVCEDALTVRPSPRHHERVRKGR